MTVPQLVGLVGIVVFTLVFLAGLILMRDLAAESTEIGPTLDEAL